MHPNQRLIELHTIEARVRAIRLYNMSFAKIPRTWSKVVDEMAFVDLTEFALHARRVIDLGDLRKVQFPSIDKTAYTYSVPPTTVPEHDFHEALNRLIHAKTVTIGHSIFGNPDTHMAISYALIETDRRSLAHISIYGLVVSFIEGPLQILVAQNKYNF